jgi:hypothetical protein
MDAFRTRKAALAQRSPLAASFFVAQRDYVRYLGAGNTVLCLHHSSVSPYDVCLPPTAVGLSLEAEAAWLLEEAKGLTEVGGGVWVRVGF